MILPAKPPFHPRQFRTCAVVGNSGDLLKTKFGKEIDAHDAVIRDNEAPVNEVAILEIVILITYKCEVVVYIMVNCYGIITIRQNTVFYFLNLGTGGFELYTFGWSQVRYYRYAMLVTTVEHSCCPS